MQLACVNNIALAAQMNKGIMWFSYLEEHGVPLLGGKNGIN
jgi:hypothetical protein